MKINKLNNNYAFGSKIIVRDYDSYCDFFKLVCLKSIECPWEDIKTGKKIYTESVSPCISGGSGTSICNGEGFIFHFLLPGKKSLDNIYKNIIKVKQLDNKPRFFITGGHKNDPTSKRSFSALIERIKEFKERTSIIWGQKDSGTNNINYSSIDDTWTIFHEGTHIKKFEDLKNAFEKIYIADGDELWIGDTKIDPKLCV